MKKITQSLVAACLFALPALAQNQKLAEKPQVKPAVKATQPAPAKKTQPAAKEIAQPTAQKVTEDATAVSGTENSVQNEKLQQEMLGLLKSSGFAAEQIEAYQEVSKKIGTELTAINQNEKIKQPDKDNLIKKLRLYQDETLKKVFTGEQYEKLLELQKQVYGDSELK